MAEPLVDSDSGLRERKKQRTRATLVDAAMQLCLKQGYENTTVEQIAAAADVSPRTFSRYFATKDSVFMTIIEDYSHEVAVALETVPFDVGPLEAMRQANVAVLNRIARHEAGRMTTERVVLMLRVINASDVLKQAATDFKYDQTEIAIAKRMGVDVDDRQRRLASAVFATIIANACGDLIADTDTVRLGPQVMVERINEAFGQIAAFAEDLPRPERR